MSAARDHAGVKQIGNRTDTACPSCGGAKSGVLDTRAGAVAGHAAPWRRRRCAACGHRWSTVEIPVDLARRLARLALEPRR